MREGFLCDDDGGKLWPFGLLETVVPVAPISTTFRQSPNGTTDATVVPVPVPYVPLLRFDVRYETGYMSPERDRTIVREFQRAGLQLILGLTGYHTSIT